MNGPLRNALTTPYRTTKYRDYFNIFLKKNGTTSGKFKVNRGVQDIAKVGEVMTFEDSAVSKTYKGDCSKINGTDGTM